MIARKWLGVVAALASFSSSRRDRISRARTQSHRQRPRATQSPNVYEDDRIRVSHPRWLDSLETDRNLHRPFAGTSKTDIVPGALLTKGKYKLYLLTHHGQASGVEGGRFGEISSIRRALGSTPTIRAIGTSIPKQPKVTAKLSRVDNYLRYGASHRSRSRKTTPKNCGAPPATGVFWYGSYFPANVSGPGENSRRHRLRRLFPLLPRPNRQACR